MRFGPALALSALLVSACSNGAAMHGAGSLAGSPFAPYRGAIHAPRSISMTHLNNFEEIGKPGHLARVPWASLSPWLSSDEPHDSLQSVGASSAGIFVGWYSDTAIQSQGGPYYTSDESTFAHDCSNSRITGTFDGRTVYLMDPESVKLLNMWVSTALSEKNTDGYHMDYVFADSSDDLRKFEIKPCNNRRHDGFDQRDWTNAIAAMYTSFEQQTSIPIMANALYFIPRGGRRLSPGIALAASVWGEETEECYSNTNFSGVNPGPSERTWVAEESAEIAIMATGKLWFCSGDYERITNATKAIPERIYQLASFLLTYQPNQAYLKQPWLTISNFRQNKETHFVPLDPVLPQPSDISSLMTSTGVYAREYAACYLEGKLEGPCVALVNSSKSASLARGFDSYRHTLLVSGSDPFDGGTVRINGPAAPAIIAPQSAYILTH